MHAGAHVEVEVEALRRARVQIWKVTFFFRKIMPWVAPRVASAEEPPLVARGVALRTDISFF